MQLQPDEVAILGGAQAELMASLMRWSFCGDMTIMMFVSTAMGRKASTIVPKVGTLLSHYGYQTVLIKPDELSSHGILEKRPVGGPQIQEYSLKAVVDDLNIALTNTSESITDEKIDHWLRKHTDRQEGNYFPSAAPPLKVFKMPNGADLSACLSSNGFRQLIGHLRRRADFVLHAGARL